MAAETFATWYKRECAGVTAFVSGEWLVKGASHATNKLNTNPPRELWPNMVPLARVMQAIRDRLGAPITLTSVYRSPAYNAAIGGAPASLHMQFKAADWVSLGKTPPEQAAAALQLRDEGFFKGGVGLYDGFVHVDVRGTNVEWDQRGGVRKPMARTGILAPLGVRAQPGTPATDADPRNPNMPPLTRPHPPEPAPEPVGMGAGATAAVGGLAAGGMAVAGGIDWGWVLAAGAIVAVGVFAAIMYWKRKGSR